MPKLTETIQRFRAQKLFKDLEKVNFSPKALAKKQGLCPQTVMDKIKRPFVQKELRLIMEKSGITTSSLCGTLKKGLKAKETKFFAERGVIKDKATTIDYATRHHYMETGLKMLGHLREVPASNGEFHVYLTKVDVNAPLEQRIQDLANNLSQDSGR